MRRAGLERDPLFGAVLRPLFHLVRALKNVKLSTAVAGTTNVGAPTQIFENKVEWHPNWHA